MLKKEVHDWIRKRRMQRFQPWDWAWSYNLSDIHASSSKQTNSFFKGLHCCAICNVTKLGIRKQKYWFVDNSYIDATTPTQGCTPFGATNSYLANLTTNALGKKMVLCTQCHLNINKPPNCDIQFTNIYEILCYNQSSTCLIVVFPWHWNAHPIKRLRIQFWWDGGH